MNCIHIVGNRPQFIKLALLHRAIAAHTTFHQTIIHTGQHYDRAMSEVFFEELGIPSPDYMLEINQLPHHAQIGRMTEQIGDILMKEEQAAWRRESAEREPRENVLLKEKKIGVIIYGDTNTSLAGALAAKKNNILVAHVEAGIRTYDESMPEESNRYLVDRIADLNFCPTYLCETNLVKEGFGQIPFKKACNTGDIMLDAWQEARNYFKAGHAKLEVPAHDFILTTIHREENNGSPKRLTEIVSALNEIHKQLPVILPCHPKTKQKIETLKLSIDFDIRPPFSFIEMMVMLEKAAYIITDSGGFCREAFFSCKPTLVIMEHPFWPEIIEYGTCLQTAAQKQTILIKFAQLKQMPRKFQTDIFGDGQAAKKMAAILEQEWKS